MQKDICRVCINNSTDLSSLFEPFMDHTASYFINCVADIKISEEDSFPNSICKHCVRELEVTVNFRDKCRKSDSYLHSLAKSLDTNFKVEVKCEELPAVKLEQVDIDYSSDHESPEVHSTSTRKTKRKSHNNLKTGKQNKKGKHKRKKQEQQTSSSLDCVECGKSFKSKCKLNVHWKNTHQQKTYTCDKCKRTFKALNTYEKHINQEVSCDVRFKGIMIEGEGKSRTYHCGSCEYKSTSMMCIKEHMVRHSGARPHVCNLCSKSYTSRKSLLYHKETVHKVYKVEITCDLCGKVVKGRHRFNRHFRFSHPNNQFQCDICKLVKKSKWALINHLRIHENLRQFICDICGRTFNISSNLRNHVRRAHEIHTFDCNLCGYKSKKSELLKKHIEQHYQEKYQCTLCFRFFSSPIKLNKHIEIHGEKKYFCFYCHKGFVRKSNCGEHEKAKHGRRLHIVIEGVL